MGTWAPKIFFVYKFGKLTSSSFQKALDDYCATFGFHFIDEIVPKKGLFFFKSRWTNIYDFFFQSHLIYISIVNMMQNCTYMFRTFHKVKKKKFENCFINSTFM